MSINGDTNFIPRANLLAGQLRLRDIETRAHFLSLSLFLSRCNSHDPLTKNIFVATQKYLRDTERLRWFNGG